MTTTPEISAADHDDLPDNVHHLRPTGTSGATGTEVEAAPVVIDAEIVDDQDAGADRPLVLVDSDDPSTDADWVARLRETQRLPIIPRHLRTLSEAKQTAVWVARHYAHATGYHAVRTPLYLLKLAARSPQGALLLMAATGRWVSDAEGRPLRREMALRGEAEKYLKLVAERNARVRLRTILLLVGSTLGVVLLLVLPEVTPTWVMWVCGMVALGILGKLGTPADSPVAGRAVIGPQAQRLTSDVVVRALSALGHRPINQALAKNPKRHRVRRTDHPRRPRLAGRRRPARPGSPPRGHREARQARLRAAPPARAACGPRRNPEVHPGRLVLWVGDQDMAKAKQPAWPLAKRGTVDLFKPVAVRHRPARPVGRRSR